MLKTNISNNRKEKIKGKVKGRKGMLRKMEGKNRLNKLIRIKWFRKGTSLNKARTNRIKPRVLMKIWKTRKLT